MVNKLKNILKQIKQYISDHKDYFIRCTFNAVIVGVIIGIVCAIVSVPSSAEASTTIIEAGSYRWNDTPDITQSFEVTLPFTTPSISYEGVHFGVWDFILVEAESESIIAYANTSTNAEAVTYATLESVGWGYMNSLFGDVFPIGYGQTITVTADTEVDDTFATWFFANTTSLGDPDPDPDPVIEAGFYKAGDSWNTSGFPVTNDSIDIRYYDQHSQAYIDVEGIAFLFENDIVEIYYQEVAVYTDGWGFASDKYIEVTQDITVEPEFYTVFNNVYETSSQGSNVFESGYSSGYNDGFSAGRDVGYNQGYHEGMAESSGNFFTDILGGVLGSLDAFTLFGGYSLLDLITTILGGFALIWILKLLAGG